MEDTFTFLGTGSSVGVPIIGCDCQVCQSQDPENMRFRASGLLLARGKFLLLDVGPDFRSQALVNGIRHLDGLLVTHTHSDHIAGIDDLRIFFVRRGQAFPCLASPESFLDLQIRYPYLFQPIGSTPTLSAQFDFHLLDHDRGSCMFEGVPLSYVSYRQGGVKVTGYRYEHFAYITDIREFEMTMWDDLMGIDTLVISMLQEQPTPLHLGLEEVIEVVQTLNVRRTYLTHLCHAIDAGSFSKRLPSGIYLGYDGLKLDLQS
jgi:phosphoribosyl 1,2-cyclic phosphate phosphodiesterase